jgi:hypothetical protein
MNRRKLFAAVFSLIPHSSLLSNADAYFDKHQAKARERDSLMIRAMIRAISDARTTPRLSAITPVLETFLQVCERNTIGPERCLPAGRRNCSHSLPT